MNTHVRLATLVLGLLVCASSLFAGQSSESMTVSVQVIARAVVTVDGPASINVTEADVARGYVDVPAPLLVRVRTNSRSGYVLQVENLSETFSSFELKSSDIEMKVGSHESWIQRPYVAGGDLMPLQARLRLAPTATAGSVDADRIQRLGALRRYNSPDCVHEIAFRCRVTTGWQFAVALCRRLQSQPI